MLKQVIEVLVLSNKATIKHEIFVARNFCEFQIFIISLHIIFEQLTIDNMGYLTAVKFRCM